MFNKKLVKFVTPKGRAVYPKLDAPDTKFKPNGEFSCKVELSAEDSAKFMAEIQAIADTHYDETLARLAGDTNPATKGKSIAASKNLKRANLPVKAVVDDEGNETGEFQFNCKMNHRITKRVTNEVIEMFPKLFDASTPPKSIPYGTQVWGGSIVRVAGEFNCFYTQQIGVGVQLRMTAVQIIDLVQGTAAGDGFGFGGEEGGFVAEDAPAPAPAEEAAPVIEYATEEF